LAGTRRFAAFCSRPVGWGECAWESPGARKLAGSPVFETMSDHCWCIFLTLKASCIRNLFHQDDFEWKLLLWCSEVAEGKCPVEMLSQVVQRDCSCPYVTPCVADFDLNYFQKWHWSSRADSMRVLKRFRPNRRMWWRCWRKVTSISASDNRNPTGFDVLTQGGYFGGDGGN
jgi:hypothetical protein